MRIPEVHKKQIRIPMKVAIQGIKGSFHHIVAEEYFGKNIDLVECMSFGEMPDLLHNKKAEVIVMAIENSIAGAILPNYALIDDHKLTICGEHYLPIHHNLMALGGQKIEDIKEVYSHPMALLQCHKFFNDFPHIKLIEDKDTAAVAKRIQDQKLRGVAAIAGSLADVLTILAKHNLNLSKIQSMPVIETPWKYAFFADFVFESYADYFNAIKEVKEKTEALKVLGEYSKSKRS